ncbi:unnamed protein product [Linum trigynum]|uniref:Uncharacterized protein n=1 Tax=Linum trigynum TaxID=586398 RepID=A0AAV2ERX1_9ROSI
MAGPLMIRMVELQELKWTNRVQYAKERLAMHVGHQYRNDNMNGDVQQRVNTTEEGQKGEKDCQNKENKRDPTKKVIDKDDVEENVNGVNIVGTPQEERTREL